MNIVKKALSTLGGILLAALLLAALAPKATHGIVAALVQVTNTTADPASTLDADKATRIPYQETSNVFCNGGVSLCTFDFNAPQAGYRLVVENVSAILVTQPGAASMPTGYLVSPYGYLSFTGNLTEVFFPPPAIVGPSVTVNQSVTTYFDHTDAPPKVEIIVDFSAFAGQTVTLTGHLIDCSVVGCPAVQ